MTVLKLLWTSFEVTLVDLWHGLAAVPIDLNVRAARIRLDHLRGYFIVLFLEVMNIEPLWRHLLQGPQRLLLISQPDFLQRRIVAAALVDLWPIIFLTLIKIHFGLVHGVGMLIVFRPVIKGVEVRIIVADE